MHVRDTGCKLLIRQKLALGGGVQKQKCKNRVATVGQERGKLLNISQRNEHYEGQRVRSQTRK